MSTGVSLDEFSQYLSEASSQGATFTSEVFKSIQAGTLAEADRIKAVADGFARDFQKYSETAAGN